MVNTYKNNRWSYTKEQWKRQNPPTNGEYICALCGKPVSVYGMSLDHIKPSAKYPELAYELTNLQPTHVACNAARARGETLAHMFSKKKNEMARMLISLIDEYASTTKRPTLGAFNTWLKSKSYDPSEWL